MKVLKNISFLFGLLLLSAATVYWIEAEKEIEILCSLFDEGESLEYVTNTLDTGNLLTYQLQEKILIADSYYNFNSSECTVEFSEENEVVRAGFFNYFNLPKSLAWIGLVLSISLMIFQLLLALGFPLGRYAWGGEHKVLPKKLRIGSFFSMIIFVFSAVLIVMNLTGNAWFSEAYPALGIIFLLSSFANLNSAGTLEMRIMTPVATLLFLCYLSLSLL